MNFTVTRDGKILDEKLYNWDEETKVFSTNEEGLVIDFTGIDSVTFKARNNCTFKTGSYCTFDTVSGCTFDTGSNCTFNTGSYCTFKTESYCTFDTGSYCTFTTGSGCTFKTGSSCTFNTEENCVIVRRDIFEVIQPEPNTKIKLNGHKTKGYEMINKKHTIIIDGKEIELLEESFNNLKKQLTN